MINYFSRLETTFVIRLRIHSEAVIGARERYERPMGVFYASISCIRIMKCVSQKKKINNKWHTQFYNDVDIMTYCTICFLKSGKIEKLI